ncbi:MAG: hypothetical protein HYW48_11460 [Deltaproteobacteria bacterium]|nr:hypothetical protein [Deltaproteobacteria bacterium]
MFHLKPIVTILLVCTLSNCKKEKKQQEPDIVPTEAGDSSAGLDLTYKRISPDAIKLVVEGPSPALLFDDWFPGFRFETSEGLVPDRILYEACFEDPKCEGDPILGMYNTSAFIVPIPLEGQWFIRFRPCLHADRTISGNEECAQKPSQVFNWNQTSLPSGESYELARLVADLHWNYQELGIEASKYANNLYSNLEKCDLINHDETARLKLISDLGPDYLSMAFWRYGIPEAEELVGLRLVIDPEPGRVLADLPSYSFTKTELTLLTDVTHPAVFVAENKPAELL